MNNLPERADRSTPVSRLAQQEFFDRLDGALRSLPAKLKTAFVLAELEGLPYKQIAQVEGVRLGTIKSRISRAKEKLRSALGNFEDNT